MTAAAQAGATRICSTCGERYPVQAFRFRDRQTGRRHCICRQCWAGYMAGWQRKRREADLHQLIRGLASATPEQLLGLVTRASRRFHGARRAAQLLGNHIREIGESRPGGRSAIQACRAMANLDLIAEACRTVQ